MLLLLTSCSHTYYIPSTHNVPIFKEKNEYRLSASFGETDNVTTKEIQAAYSITNHLAIMSNYLDANSGKRIYDNNWGKGYYFDGAIGLYQPTKRTGVFEIYGGMGTSKQHHQYKMNGSSELSFHKFFIQPSWGISFNSIDIALSSRLSQISFNKIQNNIDPLQHTEYNEVYAISVNRNHFFIEPALTLRVGWKTTKLQLQLTQTDKLTKNTNTLYPLLYTRTNICFGVFLAF
ncbi:MAG: hypothetical protein Q8K70_11775 [Bacteroidota bacterium]|nr:hypothetical protein [Bacteroidota bacterium]